MRRNPRMIVGLVVAAMALFAYWGSTSVNPTTGEKQHVAITPEQEVALGLQAAPEMAQQHGGLASDDRAQALVDQVGQKLLKAGKAGASGYPFEFHVLADDQTINAFALPGGQVFITYALISRLTTEGQLAGVLGHEIGHVSGVRRGAHRQATAHRRADRRAWSCPPTILTIPRLRAQRRWPWSSEGSSYALWPPGRARVRRAGVQYMSDAGL